MMDRHSEEVFSALRRKLTSEHDDETIQRLPPMIILGETDQRSFDRKHFSLSLTFSTAAVRTALGYLLIPDEEAQLEKIASDLGVFPEHCGIYVSERSPLSDFQPFTCTHQKLVLVKPYQEGFLLVQ